MTLKMSTAGEECCVWQLCLAAVGGGNSDDAGCLPGRGDWVDSNNNNNDNANVVNEGGKEYDDKED